MKNQFKFLSSHPLWVLYNKDYRDLLKKHNYEIWSIKFEPKHYTTIQIESIIKNMKNQDIIGEETKIIGLLNALFFRGMDYRKFTTKDIRANPLQHALKKLHIPNFAYNMRARSNKLFNEMDEDRTLLHYDHLYLLKYPFPHMPDREKEWNNILENSWCDYHGHGYREFEEPKFISEGKDNVYTTTVEEYVKQWKK